MFSKPKLATTLNIMQLSTLFSYTERERRGERERENIVGI